MGLLSSSGRCVPRPRLDPLCEHVLGGKTPLVTLPSHRVRVRATLTGEMKTGIGNYGGKPTNQIVAQACLTLCDPHGL